MKKNEKLNKLRRVNLLALTNDVERGSSKSIAEKIGISSVHFGGVRSGGRNFGFSLARKIEIAYNLPEKWLDTDHSNDEVTAYNYPLLKMTFERIYDNKEVRDLFEASSTEGKTALFDMVYTVLNDPDFYSATPSVFYKYLGVKVNEANKKGDTT